MKTILLNEILYQRWQSRPLCVTSHSHAQMSYLSCSIISNYTINHIKSISIIKWQRAKKSRRDRERNNNKKAMTRDYHKEKKATEKQKRRYHKTRIEER